MTTATATDTVLYIRGIPKDIKREFKSICALKGISLSEAIQNMIEKAIRENLTTASKRRKAPPKEEVTEELAQTAEIEADKTFYKEIAEEHSEEGAATPVVEMTPEQLAILSGGKAKTR